MMRERRYQESQKTLGLAQATPNHREEETPKIDPSVLDLLPARPKEWAELAAQFTAEQIELWITNDDRTNHTVEFLSKPGKWICLFRTGSTMPGRSSGLTHRVIMLDLDQAREIHRQHPLIDISVDTATTRLRFRRPVEKTGARDAGPALTGLSR